MPRAAASSRSKQSASSTQSASASMEVDAEDDDMEYLQLGLEMSESVLKPQALWSHTATVFEDERNKLRVVKTSETADAEVPSMACDVMKRRLNNTAISDECLASRLGLVPLRADPAHFRYRMHARGYQHSRNETEQTPDDEDLHEFGNPVEEAETSLYFCWKRKHSQPTSASARPSGDSSSMNNTLTVYTRDLEWVPVGNQQEHFTAAQVGPIHDNIILHKFAVGHEVEVYLRAVKGIGKQHAKYQPVCTAWYRMLPVWTIKEPIINENVDKLRLLMPLHADKIFDIRDEDTAGDEPESVRKQVVGVKNARYSDNANRNYQQDAFLAQAIESGRNKRHFLFTVESVGSRPSSVLALDALDLLIAKCDVHIELVRKQENIKQGLLEC